MTEGSNTYTATLSAFGYTNLQLSWANVEIDKTAPLQILGVSFDRTAEGTSVTANWTLPEGHDIVKVVFTELVGNGNTSSDNVNASHVTDKEGGIVAEFPITGDDVTSGVIDGLTANAPYWFMVHTEDAAGNKSVRARDSVAGHVAPDDNGQVVTQTIERPLSSLYDFLNTYIVPVYPDTTCWVNDFPNANNEAYMRLYFSSPSYNDYPVVGVTWEQAKAFCAWRTEYLLRGLGAQARYIQRYRLPTEIEWEYAARGKEGNPFPWSGKDMTNDKGCFYANFKPDEGNYTEDGNLITSQVGIYGANSNGLFDMAGNVAEWTSTVYTEAGVAAMSDVNPQLSYDAAKEDPYVLKRKSVRGGSWKDPVSYIRSAWRTWEYQNQPRSFIGFRCVRSKAVTTSKDKK